MHWPYSKFFGQLDKCAASFCFSRMRSESFSFYFGGLGVGACLRDAAFMFAAAGNRQQLSATVRDEDAMAVPIAKVVTFGSFKSRWTSFRVAGVALRDIMVQNVCDRQKKTSFSEDEINFPGKHNTLDVSIFILRGGRGILDLWYCVFLRITLSGPRQVVTTCKFRGRRGILWQVASHETSILR